MYLCLREDKKHHIFTFEVFLHALTQQVLMFTDNCVHNFVYYSNVSSELDLSHWKETLQNIWSARGSYSMDARHRRKS